MKVGVRYINRGRRGWPEYGMALAEAADDLGIESLWVSEHIVVPSSPAPHPSSPGGAIPEEDRDGIGDPLVTLSWLAAKTERAMLGTAVLVLPLHNPIHLAVQVATLSQLSGGRVLLGVGVGWLDAEFAVLGAEFSNRGARTDAAIVQLRALWSGAADGPFECPAAVLERPPPILVGGRSARAVRRAARLGDGFFPTPAERYFEVRDLLAREAERAGRDASDIEVTLGVAPEPALLARCRSARIDRIVVPAPCCVPDTLATELQELLDRLA